MQVWDEWLSHSCYRQYGVYKNSITAVAAQLRATHHALDTALYFCVTPVEKLVSSGLRQRCQNWKACLSLYCQFATNSAIWEVNGGCSVDAPLAG